MGARRNARCATLLARARGLSLANGQRMRIGSVVALRRRRLRRARRQRRGRSRRRSRRRRRRRRSAHGDGHGGDGAPIDAPDLAGTPCSTRITYGSAWIHGANHPAPSDDAGGVVTWDGACVDDGANSYALLSNGWKPYFSGNGACVIALDLDAAPARRRAAARASPTAPRGSIRRIIPRNTTTSPGRLTCDENCRAGGAQFGGDAVERLGAEFRRRVELRAVVPLQRNAAGSTPIPSSPRLPRSRRRARRRALSLGCTVGDAAGAFRSTSRPI